MKKCTTCHLEKPDEDYGMRTDLIIPARRKQCNICRQDAANIINRTIPGLVAKIYAAQKTASKQRGYESPLYTKQELLSWIEVQPNFMELYQTWVDSGYETNLIPSCDRKDDYLPYSFDNIELKTWNYNRSKGHKDRKSGTNTKRSKAVSQYTLDNVFIKTFPSMAIASRETNTPKGNLSSAVSGRLKTSGGFIWKEA